uniref:mRNA export protein n=1 Tax=Glossina morsitans morsitans TaxID=37546 RepID=A0A1B0FI12_GLOMM
MFAQSSLGSTSTNRMNDFEVVAPPEDFVSALEFSPATVQQNFLIAGSWDSRVCCWQLQTSKCKQLHPLMTGSWDKTLKFWDARSPNPMLAINLPEGCYCADVDYPMAVVDTAGRYVNSPNRKHNFTFKCYRRSGSAGFQDIYAINDIAFHPIHGTVGSEGIFSFWDKDARPKLKSSETIDQSITKCSFNANGQIFAYAVCYDWFKGCEDLKPRTT